MENHTKKRLRLDILVPAMLLFAVSLVSMWQSTAMALGSIYLAPASPTIVHGSNVTLSLRISPGTAVTVVQATVNFDPTKLQYVSINTSASPFDTNVQQTVGASSITISRAKLDPAGISTDSLIANITFKALQYSGNSAVTVSNANAAYNGSYTSPGASGATVMFSPGSCPSGQTGTPPNCQTSTPNPGSSGSQQSSKPSGSNQPNTEQSKTTDTEKPAEASLEMPTVTSDEWSYTTAKISVSTKTAAQVFVQYGLKRDELKFKTDLSTANTQHTLTVSKLAPGTEFFYVVTAQQGDLTSQTDVKTARTKGLSMRVALLDSQLSPIAHQSVIIQPLGLTVESDADGFVTVDNLPAGDYTLEFTVDGQKYAQHVNLMSNVEMVNGAQTAAVQTKALVYDGYTAPERNAPLHPLWWVVGGVVIGGIAGFGGMMLWRKRASLGIFIQNLGRSKQAKYGYTGPTASATADKPDFTLPSQEKSPFSDVSNTDWRNKHGN